MNIRNRSEFKAVGVLALVAALASGAPAQQRGGTPNNFFRFNYSLEEMQPIAYPAEPIATKHTINLRARSSRTPPASGSCPSATPRAA